MLRGTGLPGTELGMNRVSLFFFSSFSHTSPEIQVLTDTLGPEKVLAGFQAGRDRDVDKSLIDEQQVRSPLVRLRVQPLLEDLR